MRRLLTVELTRLRLRRAVLLLLIAAFVVPLVIGLATWWDTRPPSEADLRQIDQQVAAETQAPYVQRDLRRCLDKPGRYGIPDDGDTEAACEEIILPRPEWFSYYRDLDLAAEREQGSGLGVVVIVCLMVVMAGTTFAGHDWSSGSMSNQLLFEPRRLRVWAAKALAVTAVAAAVAAVVLSGYWLALYEVARARGITVPDGVLLDCLQMGWRGAAVAGVSAFTGYAVTMLFRSTVVTLGVLFAVTLAGGVVIGVLGLQDSGRWQPQNNVAAVVLNGFDYYVQPPDSCYTDRPPPGVDCTDQRTLSAARGMTYGGSLVAVVGLASIALFRRRDVT